MMRPEASWSGSASFSGSRPKAAPVVPGARRRGRAGAALPKGHQELGPSADVGGGADGAGPRCAGPRASGRHPRKPVRWNTSAGRQARGVPPSDPLPLEDLAGADDLPLVEGRSIPWPPFPTSTRSGSSTGGDRAQRVRADRVSVAECRRRPDGGRDRYARRKHRRSPPGLAPPEPITSALNDLEPEAAEPVAPVPGSRSPSGRC